MTLLRQKMTDAMLVRGFAARRTVGVKYHID